MDKYTVGIVFANNDSQNPTSKTLYNGCMGICRNFSQVYRTCGRFHETPRNFDSSRMKSFINRCELRRIMRRKSSCDASQHFVKSTTVRATNEFMRWTWTDHRIQKIFFCTLHVNILYFPQYPLRLTPN